jgi:dTDP-4-dehydrorhamnose 3,5-epimerase
LIADECAIEGVRVYRLDMHSDSRGSFFEIFRREWLPDVFGENIQVNCSSSFTGTLRGMHYHLKQWDLWVPIHGIMNAGLADIRPGSSTYRKTMTMKLSGSESRGLLIPPGVAHGFAALTDLTMIYVVSSYYDGSDELGIAWDDPQLGIDWGVDEPLLSGRDRDNGPHKWNL